MVYLPAQHISNIFLLFLFYIASFFLNYEKSSKINIFNRGVLMSMGSPKINYRAYPIRLPNLFSKFILSFLPSRNTPTIMFQILHVSSLLLSSLTQETQFSYFA